MTLNSAAAPVRLRCQYLTNPILDDSRPRLSWELSDTRRGAAQSAHQIVVATDSRALSDHPDRWDSGKVASSESIHVAYEGRELASGQRVCWRVRVWDQHDRPSSWSQTAFWEMGLLERDQWKASWIGVQVEPPAHLQSDPCPMFRKHFTLEQKAVRARAYVTAKGVYDLHINGQRVGQSVLTPGWTDYNKRIQYQTFDVTSLLSRDNAVGMILSSGWYCGHAGPFHRVWGTQPRALVQLHIEFIDGTSRWIVSDGSWRTTLDGAIRSSDLLMGEEIDARREMPGWSAAGFDDSNWRDVDVVEPLTERLVCSPGPSVKAIQTLAPIAQTEPSPGAHVFDLGQNMVGYARLKVRGPAGTKITLRHAEVLNPDGTLYTANLRAARCIDAFTLAGAGEQETFEPHFTFHGFRYVELTGCAENPRMSDVTGVVLHSDIEPTGQFECSNPLVNQLQRNIVWGQKGNFVDVPTDCPQRDERLGWTGDAQVFARTACFNFDVAAFMTKWMIDVVDAQRENGCYTDVAPDIGLNRDAPPAWADAGVIVPWTTYLCYGDRRMLERHYPSMQRFIEYYQKRCPDLIFRGNTYGDWLHLDAYTSCELIGTAFFAHSTELLSRIATVLGKSADADLYRALAQQVKDAFNREYVTPNGRLGSDTQTAYVLALAFDLLPLDKRPAAVANLVHDIEDGGFGHAPLVNTRKGHLSTGFVGVKDLNPVLTRFGHLDLAYKLLNNEDYPSWLYPVKHGATTIWERWDGWTQAKGFQDPGMNSFNHYAYGAIGQWLYATVAGIDIDPEHPAYKRIIFNPRPGGGLTWARGRLHSMYGLIESDWKIDGDTFAWTIAVPPNTRGDVTIPTSRPADVREGDRPLDESEGISRIGQQDGNTVCEVTSGSYSFTAPIVRNR